MTPIDIRRMTLDAIAEDEQWLARARAIRDDCDGDVQCTDESIARVHQDVDKMRALV